MTALFALIACVAFDAGLGWYVAGLICLFLDAERIV